MHSGKPSSVLLRPAPWGSGRVFVREGLAIPARLEFVVGTDGGTTLGCCGVTICVVEHLLAALAAAAISDVQIEVDGEEIPILDGSAAPWSEAIGAAGVVEGSRMDFLSVERFFS